MSKKAILDALDAVSDDSSASGSDSEKEEEEQQEQPAKKQKITVDDLLQQGYQSGPSVLFMKPPQEADGGNWAWGDGKAQKGKEDADESYEERRKTHEAATSAAEEGARLALKAAEHAAKLREQSRQEQQELKKQKQLTFQQKEKKKRDTAGMSSRGKSTVEEEKRIARNFGVYSGFD